MARSSAINLTRPRADEAQLKALAVVGALQFRQVLLQGPPAAGTANVRGKPGSVSAAVRARYDHLNCSDPAWPQQLLASQGAAPAPGAEIVSTPVTQGVAIISPTPAGFPAQIAQRLAAVLMSGPLPAALTIRSVRPPAAAS